VGPPSRVARVNGPTVTVTRIANGTYRVEHDGRNDIVYVAGSAADRWVFWNGQVFRGELGGPDAAAGAGAGPDKVRPTSRVRPASSKSAGPTTLTSPMPARVIRIPVQPGSPVKKGETLVVLEAMKMELPIRAPGDGVVTAVHCREGELVPADAVLIDVE
jgi:biotin carboxyl carrier protein